jgi:hypothetical protein
MVPLHPLIALTCDEPLPTGHANASPVTFTTFASLAGFATYFSMYAFRKLFAAASFGSVDGWHFALDFKVALVLAQVLGYAASKFIGIKVISGMQQTHRAQPSFRLPPRHWLQWGSLSGSKATSARSGSFTAWYWSAYCSSVRRRSRLMPAGSARFLG